MNIEGLNIGTIQPSVKESLIIKRDRIARSKIVEKAEEVVSRGIDIVGALCGIAILLPIVIGVWIANIITKNRGPIFYNTERIGKDGKTFKMYKFRSMVVGADEILKEYLANNPEARKEYKKYKKLKKDPRITKVGEFIRKTSLDEFPQFINVLKGDMSLVGPRPYLPREKEDMGSFFNDIVKTKPGLTGYWQVSDRSDVTFLHRLKLEQYYSNNRSLKLDIKILFKTVKAVIFGHGAAE